MSEPITTGDLTVGRWYKITEISPADPDPTLKVGDVVECAEGRPGCIDPDNTSCDGTGEWFADYLGEGEGYGAIVTAVEEVARPAQ